MAPATDARLRAGLRRLGLSPAAIAAAWPSWWNTEANQSPSARAELAFAVARRLGLDPSSLLPDPPEPRFLWREGARFKRLTTESDVEREGIASFGRSVAATLVAATSATPRDVRGVSGAALRDEVLNSGAPSVGLDELLVLCWSIGIPVAHLRVYPWRRKRMAAMSVRVASRAAVLIARDSTFRAPIAFYVAHEMGHLALGHATNDSAVVDLHEPGSTFAEGDDEERAADRFAVALLTGREDTSVASEGGVRATGRELARTAVATGRHLAMDPGVLAEIYGYSTGEWAAVTTALRLLEADPQPVWKMVNALARHELRFALLPTDASNFLDVVLGDPG